MADVKELIPEFFYLPDFLTNKNQFDLGKEEKGERIARETKKRVGGREEESNSIQCFMCVCVQE